MELVCGMVVWQVPKKRGMGEDSEEVKEAVNEAASRLLYI